MFFVGSTGTILTFLMTIFLPFFLLTAKQTGNIGTGTKEIPTISKTLSLIHSDHQAEINVISSSQEAEISKFFLSCREKTKQLEFPGYKTPLKLLSVIFYYSGNKAPPAFGS